MSEMWSSDDAQDLIPELEASAASLFQGMKEEADRLPVFQVQPSSSAEMGTSVEEDELEMWSTDDDDQEDFISELEASAASLFLGNKEEADRLPVFQVQPSSSAEMGTSVEEDELEMWSTDDEQEVFILKLEAVEPISSASRFSFERKEKNLELNFPGIHKAEATQENWMEEELPRLKLSSPGDGSEKQVDLKTHDNLSVLGAEIEQLLEPVLPAVQPSQEDAEEDLLGLKDAVLQSSANSGSQFSFLAKDLTNDRPVGTVQSHDCTVEKPKERQKKKDDAGLEEWMEQDLTDSLKQHGNTPVQVEDCKPGAEEDGKKQNENLADCSEEKQAGCSSD